MNRKQAAELRKAYEEFGRVCLDWVALDFECHKQGSPKMREFEKRWHDAIQTLERLTGRKVRPAMHGEYSV